VGAPPPALDALGATELKALVVALLGEVTTLKRVVAARLKRLKGRPDIKPSGIERGVRRHRAANG